MQAIRMVPGFGLGVVVTFGLFVLMSALIEMGDYDLDTEKAIKIQDFTMPDTQIRENIEEELPDQPDEVEAPPPEAETQDIEIDALDTGINIATGADDFQPNIGNEGGFARDTDMIPIYIPEPRYPPRAQKTGKGGYAVVSVTVTEIGSTTDIQLLEEWPENYGFGRASVKAAEKLKYNPRVINGKPVPVPDVLYRFVFNIASGKR